MNIYIVSPNKIWGGAAAANVAIAEMLSKDNVVYYNDEYFELDKHGVIYDNYPTHQLKDSNRFVEYLIEKKIDSVLWGVASILPYYMKASKKLHKLGIRQSVLFHSLAIDNSLKGKLMEFLITLSVRYVNHLVFVSKYTDKSWSKYLLIRNHPSHHVIYNPVNIHDYNIHQNDSSNRLGFVGRFSPEKQPDLFGKLASISSDLKCIAWGDGPLLSSISSLYPNVSYMGHSTNQSEIYNSFDILVMTSAFENCPMVILEARSFGIPCVVPQVGGIPEIVIDGFNGALYNNYDIKTILESVEKIQKNYRCYSANCLKTISDFSYDFLYDKWLSILS